MPRSGFRWGVVLVMLGSAGCGDSDGSAGGAAVGGAGGSPATGGGGAGGAAVVAECGAAPFVDVTTTLTDYATGAPVAGAKITTDLCPELVLETDALGHAAGKIAANATFTTSVRADGYIPILTSEERVVADFDGGGQLYGENLLPLLPHWSTSAPTMLAILFADPSAGPTCGSNVGWTFGVVGHPEAVVTYYGGDAVPAPDPALTATGPIGSAEISGLAATAPGEWIELTATKAGCDASFVSYPHTGRHRLEDGVLTVAGAFSPPHPTP